MRLQSEGQLKSGHMHCDCFSLRLINPLVPSVDFLLPEDFFFNPFAFFPSWVLTKKSKAEESF
jgi:hypothetical protein